MDHESGLSLCKKNRSVVFLSSCRHVLVADVLSCCCRVVMLSSHVVLSLSCPRFIVVLKFVDAMVVLEFVDVMDKCFASFWSPMNTTRTKSHHKRADHTTRINLRFPTTVNDVLCVVVWRVCVCVCVQRCLTDVCVHVCVCLQMCVC